jgi:phosphatidylinositol-3-phosphatase
VIRRLAVSLALAVGLLGASSAAAAADVPHYKHVFIIVLENEDASATFGPQTEIPYLANTLTSQGAWAKNYYATGHNSLDNYISMVSGQAPNFQTQADCQFYTDFIPVSGPDANGQFVNPVGGCVYPAGAQNIATQLQGNGYTWKGYMQDMASSAPAEPSTCRHPKLNSQDGTQSARPGDQYAARHNPFVYFHSIIDSPSCDANDVDLGRLGPDLASEATTPDYAFITPDLCNDGHDEPCIDGQPGGMTQANTFLKGLIPQITSSPAYKDRGLIIVTFDEAESHDSSACCDEQAGPNLLPPLLTPGFQTPGPGGGRIGAVLLSNCIQPGTVSAQPYNHYSLLRSVEDNFGLPHLGYAGQAGLRPFGTDLLNEPSCPQSAAALCRAKRKQKKGKHGQKRSASTAKGKHKHKPKQCKKKKRKKKKHH